MGGETPDRTAMADSAARKAREAARPRKGTVSAELGANASLQDGEILEVSARETQAGPGRPTPADRRMERRNSAPQGSYQRHMPMEVLKMPIPRKTKEKRGKLTSDFRQQTHPLLDNPPPPF